MTLRALTRVPSNRKPVSSRYATEFEEIGFIGAGGFGAVVKCRLRAEAETDHLFAVKKIHLTSNTKDDDFVLREATNLASLQHQHIVRYYSAWIEVEALDAHVVALSKGPSSSTSNLVNVIMSPGPCRLSSRVNFSFSRADSLHKRMVPSLIPSATTPYFFSSSFRDPSNASSRLYEPSADSFRLPQQNIKTYLRETLLLRPSPIPSNSSSNSAESDSTDSDENGVSDHDCSGDNFKNGDSGSEQSTPKTRPRVPQTAQKLLSDSSSSFLRFDKNSDRSSTGTHLGFSSLKTASPPQPTEQRKCSTQLFKRTLFIAMEFVEGMTLRKAINLGEFVKHKNFIWDILRQLCEGLTFMHGLEFVHRDLKPENVFLKEREKTDNDAKLGRTKLASPWQVKIGDFGLSTFLNAQGVQRFLGSHEESRAGLSVGIGTQFYIAPEVEQGEGQYHQAADMFALGIIIFEISTPPPKTVMERHKLLQSLIECRGRNAGSLGVEDALAAELIEGLLTPDTSARLSAYQVLQRLPRQTTAEAEFVLNAIMASPYSHEMLRLLTSLFNRSETADRARNFWSGHVPLTKNKSRTITEIKVFIHQLLRTFNALQIDLPMVEPRLTDSQVSAAFSLLDASGARVSLPTNLLESMKDTLGSVQIASVVRRFALQPVFYSAAPFALEANCLLPASAFDASLSRPASDLSLGFDNVVNKDKLERIDRDAFSELSEHAHKIEALFEVEPMRICWIVLQAFRKWIGTIDIFYSYGRFLVSLLAGLLKIEIPTAWDIACEMRRGNILDCYRRVRDRFMDDATTDQAIKFLDKTISFRGTAHEFQTLTKDTCLSSLMDPEAGVWHIIDKAVCVQHMLQTCIGPVAKTIRFCPILNYDARLFNTYDGFVFGCAAPDISGHSRLDSFVGDGQRSMIAIGGCYTQRGSILERERQIAFGLEVNLQMIIDSIFLSLQDPGVPEVETHLKWKRQWRDHFLSNSTTTDQTAGKRRHSSETETGRLKEIPAAKSKKSRRQAKGRQRQAPAQDSALFSTGQQHYSKSVIKRLSNNASKVRVTATVGSAGEAAAFAVAEARSTSTEDTISRSESRLQFLLLPPPTPLASRVWLSEISRLVSHTNSQSNAQHELTRIEADWRAAIETSFAPPYLRRFFPSGASLGFRPGCVVLIVAHAPSQMATAYQMRLRLCRLHIVSVVSPVPIPALANARKKMKLDETCDWLLYVTTRNKHTFKTKTEDSPHSAESVHTRGTFYRLYPCQASRYAQHYPKSDLSTEEGDKWFQSSPEVLTFLVLFYLELLGAMSPSAGQLMGSQRGTMI